VLNNTWKPIDAALWVINFCRFMYFMNEDRIPSIFQENREQGPHNFAHAVRSLRRNVNNLIGIYSWHTFTTVCMYDVCTPPPPGTLYLYHRKYIIKERNRETTTENVTYFVILTWVPKETSFTPTPPILPPTTYTLGLYLHTIIWRFPGSSWKFIMLLLQSYTFLNLHPPPRFRSVRL
jgi:hypothetical protein